MLSFLKPTLSFLKKTFLVFIVFSAVIALFSYFISKDKTSLTPQTDSIKQNRAEIYKVINDKKLNKTQQGKIIIALYKSTMCGMIGEACSNNPNDADKNYPKSVFGFITKLIILPYTNPPASGIAWVSGGLQQAGFIPKTMAAEGIGFAAIKPFANLWKIFRDLSYMLLVIVLIAIGFMIMFRAKINPQTVISVENALPKIVISLILITFSFAIAGFLIDLMYVVIIIIISVLSKNNTFYNATNFQNEYLSADITHLFSDVAARNNLLTSGIFTTLSNSLLGLFPPIVSLFLRSVVGVVTTVVFNNMLSMNLQAPFITAFNGIIAFAEGAGNLPQLLGIPFNLLIMFVLFLIGSTAGFSLIMYVLIIGTFILLVFRIFALLFSSYIKLLLLVIISPFLLIFEAVPGKNIFSWWIKNIIGHLIAFPITIAIFLIGYIIVNSTVPQGYSDMRLPYLYGIDSNSFKIIIGLGLIILIPDLVKVTKEALGIKDLPLNIGVGTFFGGAAAVGGGLMGGVGQFGSMTLALGALGPRGVAEKLGRKIPILSRMLGPYPAENPKTTT